MGDLAEIELTFDLLEGVLHFGRAVPLFVVQFYMKLKGKSSK